MHKITSPVKIKICGITRQEDYNFLVQSGIDYTGFIFYPKSPRYIRPERAAEIISSGPKGMNKKTGVFVNENPQEIVRICRICGINTVQLHGDEPATIGAELCGLEWWKAFRIKDINDIRDMNNFLSAEIPVSQKPAALLADAWAKDVYGGTGTHISINFLPDITSLPCKIFLAGGLGPDNAAEYLQSCGVLPYGIDVNSGVEYAPGVKDHGLIKRLICVVTDYCAVKR